MLFVSKTRLVLVLLLIEKVAPIGKRRNAKTKVFAELLSTLNRKSLDKGENKQAEI